MTLPYRGGREQKSKFSALQNFGDSGFYKHLQDFTGGPVVKTLPSNAGGAGSIPCRGAKIPHALGAKKSKHKGRSNFVTDSMKTLKMVHIKKNPL